MGTVLIVDDATFMRATLKRIVLESGHEVAAEARNGDEAINQYRETNPDLVLLDILMPPSPKAKDGMDALKQIMRSDSSAKVVMCSSMAQTAVIAEAMKAGARDYIVKPFEPEKIMEVIARCFH